MAGRAPVCRFATGPARELLGLLYDLSASGLLLAGQHNQPMHGSDWTRWATGTGGATPALWGQEIGFSAPGTKDAVDRRADNAAEAVEWHRRGVLITYTWHAVCPTDDEPVEFDGGVLRSFDRDDFAAVVDPGSELNARWQAQVDRAATVLGGLAEAGVPVLWRPYHEMNGSWFWWGGQPDLLRRLWRLLFERLVDHHGLTNLIWVWSPNAAYGGTAPFAEYYPGHDMVDALAVDTYGHFEHGHYDALLAVADGRPIGLGEVGQLPSLEVLADQPRWCWFLAWPDLVAEQNAAEQVRAVYQRPNTLTLDGLRSVRTSRVRTR